MVRRLEHRSIYELAERRYMRLARNAWLVIREILANGVVASHVAISPIRYWIYRSCGIHTQTANIRAGCFFTNEGVRI